jgi:hypothetical protein
MFERSPMTQKIVRYLSAHEKQTLVPYRELAEHVGEPVSSRTSKLRTAIRILEKDSAQVWKCIAPNVGVYRFNDAELAKRLDTWWLRGSRRKLVRGGQQADIVETTALDADQLTAFSVDCIQRELAFQSLSRATRNRLAKTARGTSNDLPSFNILEWAVSLTRRP